ncbi:non-structural maintenance of chromosomes element 1 homolog isoform X1 [Macrobrachium rosenbergii]|uniref:non-structural maintenance of chromosomes element 1 homolog isoform X1 n=1 Tax=Macrobrachium rosenbergii TaxID=79674 RepID=UPI0034D6129C
MDGYGDAHRYFLQHITAKRILSASEVKSTYQLCCSKFGVGQDCDLKTFVMKINHHITPMGLAIKKYSQEDFHGSSQCFLLVNTWNTEATRRASSFTQQEFSFLRKLIDAMVNSEGAINLTEATNLAAHAEPKMKLSDGEVFINRLIKNQWLLQDEDNICLSALSYAELQTYLDDTYGDRIPKCVLCKLITFLGYECPSCKAKVHRMCAEVFWQKAKSPSCPEAGCKVPWSHIEVNTTKRPRS